MLGQVLVAAVRAGVPGEYAVVVQQRGLVSDGLCQFPAEQLLAVGDQGKVVPGHPVVVVELRVLGQPGEELVPEVRSQGGPSVGDRAEQGHVGGAERVAEVQACGDLPGAEVVESAEPVQQQGSGPCPALMPPAAEAPLDRFTADCRQRRVPLAGLQDAARHGRGGGGCGTRPTRRRPPGRRNRLPIAG